MLTNDKDFIFSSNEAVKLIKAYLQQEQGLSKRESEVVILVVQGLTNKQVADQLCVAEKTVKFHLTNVYKRMKISRRSQIIWSLPIAQFREKVKNKDNIAVSYTPQVSSAAAPEPETAETIPVGSSTVTDNLDM